MRKSKSIDVQKFGGIDHLGKTKLDGNTHDVDSIEVESKTKLESDEGRGRALVMRSFTFKVDRQVFKIANPTKQDIFNSHAKGLEAMLWRDGLVFAQSHEPHILFNKKRSHYTVFVVATPARGQTLLETPKTLGDIIRGE